MKVDIDDVMLAFDAANNDMDMSVFYVRKAVPHLLTVKAGLWYNIGKDGAQRWKESIP